MNMMLNKYKYSLNRGLNVQFFPKKRGINIKTYAIVSQSSPNLYDVHINEQDNMVVLYNDHEYMHRQCTYATSSHNPSMLSQITPHYIANHNNLTVFVANDPIKSEQMFMGFQNNSLLHQTYSNLVKGRRPNSKIGLSIVGVKSENILTDELESARLDPDYGLQTIRPIMRLNNLQNKPDKYWLENLSKKYIEDQKALEEAIIQYKERRNTNQYMSVGEESWDWLQAELFIFNQYSSEDQSETSIKCHYILKVNQYLQTTSSLMLQLGIILRKLEEQGKGLETNQAKIFKLLSNCWVKPKSLEAVHVFLQIGHKLTLKEQYLNLVPVSEVRSNKEGIQMQQLPFIYIKNYQQFPKITSLLSKLNHQNSKAQRTETNVKVYSNRLMGLRPRSYARETLSSIQKKRVNNILKQFEESECEQNKNLESIIQEAASLYKQANPSFRLSYHKQSNIEALKRHKKLIQTLNATNPDHLFHSERVKSQHNAKTPNIRTNKWHSNKGFEMYTKNRRTRNIHREKVRGQEYLSGQAIKGLKEGSIIMQDIDRLF